MLSYRCVCSRWVLFPIFSSTPTSTLLKPVATKHSIIKTSTTSSQNERNTRPQLDRSSHKLKPTIFLQNRPNRWSTNHRRTLLAPLPFLAFKLTNPSINQAKSSAKQTKPPNSQPKFFQQAQHHHPKPSNHKMTLSILTA